MMRINPFQGFNPIRPGLPGKFDPKKLRPVPFEGGLKKPGKPIGMPIMPMLGQNPFMPMVNRRRMGRQY